MAAASPLKLRIEGMDCGACAVKIENAMKRLPGVSDIDVSYGLRSLSLVIDEDRTSRSTIVAKISALGFTPMDTSGKVANGAHVDRDSTGRAWWSSSKGRLVIGSGVLLALATIVSHVEPSWSHWAYIAATLVGLVPIGRRALAGAVSSTPFSIETLMSIAAIGAVAIGQAGEAAVVVFLFAVGELLEGVAAGRARAGIKALIDLVPPTARRQRGSEIETVPVEAIAIGDLVVVRPGDRVPSDGTVVEGVSQVSEAPVTGESFPFPRCPARPSMPAASTPMASSVSRSPGQPPTTRSPVSSTWSNKRRARRRRRRASSTASAAGTRRRPWSCRCSWSSSLRCCSAPIGSPGSIAGWPSC